MGASGALPRPTPPETGRDSTAPPPRRVHKTGGESSQPQLSAPRFPPSGHPQEASFLCISMLIGPAQQGIDAWRTASSPTLPELYRKYLCKYCFPHFLYD
ncbi:hypothetical protein SKAU_G00031480 [Synaphobranchus kaupii]|uniref:Uncharacterized protein n=1 Tax=Synaphobranchus kaupii TaxID=118154 RepID=A0A9Q1GDW8_SYNKA|nr:hypothetical protein SKAU_G00031480 [Synaphobranchus kaupii]